jgi:hypothetical protein
MDASWFSFVIPEYLRRSNAGDLRFIFAQCYNHNRWAKNMPANFNSTSGIPCEQRCHAGLSRQRSLQQSRHTYTSIELCGAGQLIDVTYSRCLPISKFRTRYIIMKSTANRKHPNDRTHSKACYHIHLRFIPAERAWNGLAPGESKRMPAVGWWTTIQRHSRRADRTMSTLSVDVGENLSSTSTFFPHPACACEKL